MSRLRIALGCCVLLLSAPDVRAQLIGVIGDGGGNGLFEIDPNDGSYTILNSLGNGDDGEGIAYNPNNGLLYHVSGFSDGSEYFETIDPNNGFSVGPNLAALDTYGPDMAQELTAIAWYESLGVFLVMDRNANWFHVTPGGSFHHVGTYNGEGLSNEDDDDHYLRGLAVVGSRVYGIAPGNGIVEELNPETGNALDTINFTVDGNPGVGGTAFAYDAGADIVYAAVRVPGQSARMRYLASFDFATGGFTTIGLLPQGVAGLTVIAPPVPEPSCAVMLLTAVALVAVRSRHIDATKGAVART